MEEATTTKYILSVESENMRNQMLHLMKLPLHVQRFGYFKDKVPKIYAARVVVDKLDRISVIDKQFQLRLGNNGLFIKQGYNTSAITYHKKGRSSARIRFWGNSYNTVHNGKHELVVAMAEQVIPEAVELLRSKVIKEVGTQGMYGSIMAGKITTTKEAMEYYIRYSMRGVGIKQDNAEQLYAYFQAIDSMHVGVMVLRNAKDPNSLLEQFQDPVAAMTWAKSIDDQGSRLSMMARVVSEKIDWVNPRFNASSEAERLSRKEGRIEDFLNIWEGGPVLKVTEGTQSYGNTQWTFNNEKGLIDFSQNYASKGDDFAF